MADPIFFLSYARKDDEAAAQAGRLNAHNDDSNFVDAFYRQLCSEVSSLTARSHADVGFFDQRHLSLSSLWPDELVKRLRTTSVMVALFTPTYFSRPACGREFEIFTRRHAALCKELGRTADHRIIPIFWVRPDVARKNYPLCRRDDLSKVMDRAPNMPEEYLKEGLSRMYWRGSLPDISRVCQAVADKIYEFSESREILPDLGELNFAEIPSAFHETVPDGQSPPVDAARREVRVFYLVPTRPEWSTVENQDAEGLGEARETARPFSDARGATIRSATEEGVLEFKRDLPVAHMTLPDDLGEALSATKNTRTTSLVVFDRRAIKVPILRKAVDAYVERNFENTGFVTVAGGELADEEINGACRAKIGALPKLHNWNVPNGRTDYVKSVSAVVAELDMRLVRNQTNLIDSSGDQIPGLSSPSS